MIHAKIELPEPVRLSGLVGCPTWFLANGLTVEAWGDRVLVRDGIELTGAEARALGAALIAAASEIS